MKIDIAVMEVGMGGRLDSTNIVDSKLSIITNIGLDHTAFLGDTKSKIAKEKAGIIKAGIPVIIGEKDEETDSVFIKCAKEKNSQLYFAEDIVNLEKINSKDFDFQIFKTEYSFVHSELIKIPLLGNYQIKNLKTVICALKIALDSALIQINTKQIISGLIKTTRNTGLKGRWQIIHSSPLTVADTAHNEHGIQEVIKQLESINAKQKHFVLGVVNDKDLDKILKHFPKNGTYYFCKPNIPRGLNVEILKNKAFEYGLIGKSYGSCKDALTEAQNNANKKDLIYIGGSTFVVAEII